MYRCTVLAICIVMPNICPSVCLCISALPSEAKSKEGLLPVQSVCLCACNQGVYADNNANAVDRRLIFDEIAPMNLM